MTASPIEIEERFIDSQGYALHLRRFSAPARRNASLCPVLMVPGFAMNTFILSYPPGRSMISTLAEAGFEVWALNMRGQGPSRPQRRGLPPPSLWSYAGIDLPSGIEHVLAHTTSTRAHVHLIGSSLGGSLVYAYLALHACSHRVASAVTLGAPLRWDRAHPLLRLLSHAPALVGSLRLHGFEPIARKIVPRLSWLPILSLYVNLDHVDLSQAENLLQTLTFSDPTLNREMARWVAQRDLIVQGLAVPEALRAIDRPLLAFIANRDGLVPSAAVRSVERFWGGRDLSFIEVGSDDDWYAHADLFIAPQAPQLVFEPMARWLLERDLASD